MTKGVGWVPENQRCTAWYLWNRMFMCRVPFIHTMSMDYLQHFGMPSSGDAAIDRQTANELVVRMLSIHDMVEFYQRGVTIAVVQIKDTKIIYELITDHLNAWKRELEIALNTRNAPIDDLILFDKFANVVYRHAKYQFTEEIVESILHRKMAGAMRVHRANLFKYTPYDPKPVKNKDGEETDQHKYPDRISMADIFANRKAAGRPKWK